jgi:hypothetical protein
MRRKKREKRKEWHTINNVGVNLLLYDGWSLHNSAHGRSGRFLDVPLYVMNNILFQITMNNWLDFHYSVIANNLLNDGSTSIQ